MFMIGLYIFFKFFMDSKITPLLEIDLMTEIEAVRQDKELMVSIDEKKSIRVIRRWYTNVF